MIDEYRLILDEAHRYFAQSTNGRVWDLLHAANSIANDEDRSIFMGDFDGGEWYGLR